MAKAEVDQTATQPAASDAPAIPKPAAMGKLKLFVLMAALVGVECVLAYFLIPGTPQADASVSAEHTAPPATEHASPPEEKPAAGEPNEQVEVDLGQFSVTAFQPATSTTLRIEFHLWGTVASSDQATFQEAWTKNNNRLRDQVIYIVRGANISDVTDAGLGLIKRKILEKTNKTLSKPYLQAVIFSDFSFLEQ